MICKSGYHYNATLRGGSPDSRRTRIISPLGGNCRAVGQVEDSPWRETHRAQGQVALWYYLTSRRALLGFKR